VIVLDASAAVEYLLKTPLGEGVAERLSRADGPLHVPHLLDVEVVHVLRRLNLSGRIQERRARQVLGDLAALPLIRYPHDELVGRVWSLRDMLTAYDAMYVALAEGLEATLVTCDERLGRAHGHKAEVDVVTLAS
jgi:predicted nucleic acid-binding protein